MKPQQMLSSLAILTNPIVIFFLVLAAIVGLMQLSISSSLGN